VEHLEGEIWDGVEKSFSDSLIALSLQGGIREIDSDGLVGQRIWASTNFLPHADIGFCSMDDLNVTILM
jgi:hypothetical protein